MVNFNNYLNNNKGIDRTDCRNSNPLHCPIKIISKLLKLFPQCLRITRYLIACKINMFLKGSEATMINSIFGPEIRG